MLFTVAAGLLYHMETRMRLIEVFPENVRKTWNDWELRLLIIISLISQITQILLANRRKYIPRTRLRIMLWFAYMAADLVATVALGIISKDTQFECDNISKHDATKNQLVAFWAPFLLLHLGGPDTITAYSLQDNDLWLRHLLGLAIQVSLSLYVFLEAWRGSKMLPVLSIFVLLLGLVKYCERVWALRGANSDYFRDSLLTPPDPGPDYVKFMGEYTLRKAQGFLVKAEEVIEVNIPPDFSETSDEVELISKAYDLFQTFKRLFADLILSFQDREKSQPYFRKLDHKEAFHVVEIELGFAYDILYTKASLSYTIYGCILRFFSFSFTIGVLMGFQFLVKRDDFDKFDVVVTYLLLAVAIFLEFYTFMLMLSSDYVDCWLSVYRKKHYNSMLRPKKSWWFNVLCDSRFRKPKKLWWSNSMAQYNLLSVCFDDKPAFFRQIQKFFGVHEYREKHRHKTYNKVSDNLKELIFNQLTHCTNYTCRTNYTSFALLEHENQSLKEWRTPRVEFDQQVLLWHIATDLCYYLEYGENQDKAPINCQESKHISDYMLYLMKMYPFMLPMGIGMIRIRDTCAEVREHVQEKVWKGKQAEACRKLLQVNTEVLPAKVKGDRSKSVLFDACRLAKSLHSKGDEKWKIVNDAWVGMLAFAATHCRGNHHAQQLRKGGELLTHVWLLMAHLGITEQFQIDQGHARTKLNVK